VFAQRFLLFSELFLFPAEFLLWGPELPSALDCRLIANDVRLLVALEPDKVARNLFPQLLDVPRIFGCARHRERIRFARGDHETLFIIEAIAVPGTMIPR